VIAPLPARPMEPTKVAPKQAAKKETDFSKRWRRHRVSAMSSAKSTLATIALASRVRLAQLQSLALSSSNRLSEQWSIWRKKQSNFIKTNVKWNDLTSSWLRWLRAPSQATMRRTSLKAPRPAPQAEVSARIPAGRPLPTGSLRRVGGSKVIGSLKKTPSVSAYILQWLQEPSHAVRERKPPRSSTTHLP
jgi:hypothetical protein